MFVEQAYLWSKSVIVVKKVDMRILIMCWLRVRWPLLFGRDAQNKLVCLGDSFKVGRK